MTRQDLLNALGELTDEEFENFKWNLKDERVKDSSTISSDKLEDVERRGTVDLMIQTFTLPGAVESTKKILKAINRNDLVQKLPKAPGQLKNKICYYGASGRKVCVNADPNLKKQVMTKYFQKP